MPYVKPLLPGRAYGLGTASAAVSAGYPVKVTGNDAFAHADAAGTAIGIAFQDTAIGKGVTVYLDGGVYETDVFETGIAAGDPLKVGTTKKLAKSTDAEDFIVGIALSVASGVMTYHLYR